MEQKTVQVTESFEVGMSGKRKDYISWDEYFMGVAVLWECVRKIRIRRWVLHCQRRSQDTLDGV